VTYRSSGFLRGGVGDEYPVHVLAAHGMAVLSLDIPNVDEYLSVGQDLDSVMRALWKDQFEFRSIEAALDRGIQLTEESGLVDGGRIAVTGLSMGAQTVFYSLLHSQRSYAAAIASGNSWDPIGFYTAPEKSRRQIADFGVSYPDRPDGTWWQVISPALNAQRIHAPLLMNVADRELISCMQTISALQEYHKPYEAYVYPDEYHVKRWPAHRFAIYERNLDWLRFWLQDYEDPDPAKAEQYRRWRELRKVQEAQDAERASATNEPARAH
jgi:dienelactone hydrolase